MTPVSRQRYQGRCCCPAAEELAAARAELTMLRHDASECAVCADAREEVAAVRQQLKEELRVHAQLQQQLSDAEHQSSDLEARLKSAEEEGGVLQSIVRSLRQELRAAARAPRTLGEEHAVGSPSCDHAPRFAEAPRRGQPLQRAASGSGLQRASSSLSWAESESSCHSPPAGRSGSPTVSPGAAGAALRRAKQREEELREELDSLRIELAAARRRFDEERAARREAEADAVRARCELHEQALRAEVAATEDGSCAAPSPKRTPAQPPSADPAPRAELAELTDSELQQLDAAYGARITQLAAAQRDVARQLHANQPSRFPDPDAAPQGPETPDRGSALDADWTALAHWMRERFGERTSLRELRGHLEHFAPRRMRSPAPTWSPRWAAPAREPPDGQSVCSSSLRERRAPRGGGYSGAPRRAETDAASDAESPPPQSPSTASRRARSPAFRPRSASGLLWRGGSERASLFSDGSSGLVHTPVSPVRCRRGELPRAREQRQCPSRPNAERRLFGGDIADDLKQLRRLMRAEAEGTRSPPQPAPMPAALARSAPSSPVSTQPSCAPAPRTAVPQPSEYAPARRRQPQPAAEGAFRSVRTDLSGGGRGGSLLPRRAYSRPVTTGRLAPRD
eukprot:TRINITY_DN65700_c0_g1_i1.p1 TRINITY_DN65700_c0_g1~~TRINITY_DN65700_c0_g1_i1.p1  ORF type:complete len:626 (+),score=133.08 TRINITY_DN65700_c0_g1_i1:65-1942(+)